MTDLIFPQQARRTAQSSFKYIDSTGMTRGIYTGAAETTAYGGDRLTASITLPPLLTRPAAEGSIRAAVLAWVLGLKGRQNRTWLRDGSYQQRGSFPSAELLPNGAFASTSGWTALNGSILRTVDGVMRVTLVAAGVQQGANFNTIPVTANVPYVARAFLRTLRGAPSPGVVLSDGVAFTSTFAEGLASTMLVPSGNGVIFQIVNSNNTGLAGDHYECSYASLSRCALVDGGPNQLLHSDAPGGTSWNTLNLGGVVSGTDPSGLTTAVALTETTVNGQHYVTQGTNSPTGRANHTFSVYVKKGLRDWCFVQMADGGAGAQTVANAYFNANTGAIGASRAVGASWANLQVFSEACGNGWFRFTICALKTNPASGIIIDNFVGPATTDGVSVYAGSTASPAISVWRASAAVSLVPTRAVQTTAAAAPAVGPTGQSIWLKGLPVSSQGLLLVGDEVQIGKQLVFITASLDSNEAGLGYLQFSPPLRYAPADNDPVIILNPMGRFMFSGQYPEWAHTPGIATTVSLDFEEACEP